MHDIDSALSLHSLPGMRTWHSHCFGNGVDMHPCLFLVTGRGSSCLDLVENKPWLQGSLMAGKQYVPGKQTLLCKYGEVSNWSQFGHMQSAGDPACICLPVA